jgi:hypothetical protein
MRVGITQTVLLSAAVCATLVAMAAVLTAIVLSRLLASVKRYLAYRKVLFALL